MAENTVPPCIYCGLPVPISDNSEYTLLNLEGEFNLEGEYRYSHNAFAENAAGYPLQKPIEAIRVTKSRARREDECA